MSQKAQKCSPSTIGQLKACERQSKKQPKTSIHQLWNTEICARDCVERRNAAPAFHTDTLHHWELRRKERIFKTIRKKLALTVPANELFEAQEPESSYANKLDQVDS